MSENKMTSEPDAVLSSVRRLVTQVARSGPGGEPGDTDPRHGPAAEADAAAPGATPEAGAGEGGPVEKLLLTPSLRVEDEAVDTVPAPPRPVAGRAPSLEQRIAELEAAVGGRDEEWEPDGSELVDEETPRRFVFQHTPRDTALEPPVPMAASGPFEAAPAGEADGGVPEAPAAILDEAAEDAEPAPAAEAQGAALSLADESVIDEDMLRDLVSEIVRSELQGELGERITRNVRKLVRREIHRAIMTRDFG